MAPPSTPPPRMTPSPSPSFPSSPSSRAPSTIDDPTFSDVSSLDDEDYELIDGQTPSAVYGSTDLSASRSWMSDSLQSGSPHTGLASLTAASTQMADSTIQSRDRQESRETALNRSWAASEDQSPSAPAQKIVDHDVDTPISSTHHLSRTGPTTDLPSSTIGGNVGGSGGSTVSTWILPDPTSPEHSINLGHMQQGGTPSTAASKSNSDQQSSLEGSRGLPVVDPVWRRTLGASWEKTLDSELSSSEPQLGQGCKGLTEAGAHKQGDISTGEKQPVATATTSDEPLEPDWAQKTKAWLQISGSGTSGAFDEATGARNGNAAKIPKDARETDRNLRGLVHRGSNAARAHMKIAFPTNASRGMLLHWLVAALCGFMGAVVLLHPSIPTEAIRVAMSFSPIGPLAPFNDVRRPSPPASVSSAEVTPLSKVSRTSQPIETAAISAPSSSSSFELLIVDIQTKERSNVEVGSSVPPAADEDKALTSSSTSDDLSEVNAPISEWVSKMSQVAWHTLKTSSGVAVVALYAEWYYWETKLKSLWFEVMEPMLKQMKRDLEAVMSTLGTDLWDVTSFASAYGQAMSTSATETAHVVLKHSEAAHKATMKQAEALYEAYLKEQLSENRKRASQHLDKAKKTAQHLRAAGGEHAVHFYQCAKGHLGDWSREAAKVAEAGKETWSELSASSAVSSRARQVVLNAERGKKAILEAIEARHRAVGGARGSPSSRSGASPRSRAARKSTTKRGERKGQAEKRNGRVDHTDFLSEAAAPLHKASQQARDTLHAQWKRAGKGSDAAKKKLQEGLSSLDEQLKRATKKAKVGKTPRHNLRGEGFVMR